MTLGQTALGVKSRDCILTPEGQRSSSGPSAPNLLNSGHPGPSSDVLGKLDCGVLNAFRCFSFLILRYFVHEGQNTALSRMEALSRQLSLRLLATSVKNKTHNPRRIVGNR